MQTLKIINQIIAFSLEIGMLIVMGYWGAQQGKILFMKFLIPIALCSIAIILWGIFAAPKSAHRLEFTIRILFEMALFTIAALMLYKTDHKVLAISFWVIAFLNEMLSYVFKDQPL